LKGRLWDSRKAIGAVIENTVAQSVKTVAARRSTQPLKTVSRAPLIPKPSSATLIAM
jgi:hypothetical protein